MAITNKALRQRETVDAELKSQRVLLDALGVVLQHWDLKGTRPTKEEVYAIAHEQGVNAELLFARWIML